MSYGLCGVAPGESVQGGLVWGGLFTTALLGMCALFLTTPHAPNNYRNASQWQRFCPLFRIAGISIVSCAALSLCKRCWIRLGS